MLDYYPAFLGRLRLKKLVIFGGSGIGMIAASVALELGEYDVLGFLNDYLTPGQQIGRYRSFEVLGGTDYYRQLIDTPDLEFFVAYVGLSNEKETFEKVSALAIPTHRYATLIHPSAVVPKDMCRIGRGVLLAPLAQLSPDTSVDDNCILLANSFVGHDTTLKRFAHIATNGVVGANVTVGRAVHIGSNATIREKTCIGDFSLIGSGSMVLRDVPENAVVVGNPARLLKQRN
mgnify:CR=1 FL=1